MPPDKTYIVSRLVNDWNADGHIIIKAAVILKEGNVLQAELVNEAISHTT